MTDSSLVHYIFIVDRSGSMQTIKTDTEGGIRAFIEKQLEDIEDPATRTVSFYQFDTEHDEMFDFTPLEEAKDYMLIPRGGTALLDAIGQAITRVGGKLAALPEDKRPGHVMVVIATDGEENSSREYKKADIKKMIEHQQQKYNWKFTFAGANQDAFAEARSIGIPACSTLNFSGRSTVDAWHGVATATSGGTVSTSAQIFYTPAQRDAAK